MTDLGAPWTGGGLVSRSTGRVFFTRGGLDYTCSATALSTPDASTVLTAAHCVYGDGRYASRWVFVPGWQAGRAPYGIFVAAHFAVPSGFLAGDLGQDVAFVDVGPNPAGQTLGQAVGGLPIRFWAPEFPVSGVHAFGYPQDRPFDGSALVHCAGAARVDSRGTTDLGLGCRMTAGASGGPWLTDLDPVAGTGRVVAVTSFAYVDDPGTLYGPTFSAPIAQLYASVAADRAA